jgi:hypothetical protein
VVGSGRQGRRGDPQRPFPDRAKDFQAISDPALQQSADRGEIKLLDYRQLYLLRERQQWRTQDLDFSQDRIDWHERFDDERFQRMHGLGPARRRRASLPPAP